jgi:L-lactate dehydrogenase (cytochrome)
VSVKGNREAFDRYKFVPRVMVDTTTRSTQTETFGQRWHAPFAIAPMGAMAVAVPDADRILARAAAIANIPFVLSGASLRRMEDVIQVNRAAWFQAYLTAQVQDNLRLIERAESSGFRTLFITADVAVGANRENDVRNGYTSPLRPSFKLLADGLRHPKWMINSFLRPMLSEGIPKFENFGVDPIPMLSRAGLRLHRRDNFNWESLKHIRQLWKHRLLLKGILDPEDVTRAREMGLDGVIASNHGGRQLDCTIAPLDMVAEMAQAAGSMPVMMDSGIRRGTDVLKALALGAQHVFIGRPFLYAAVVGGQAGVTKAIELLQAEIYRDMALLGAVDFSNLNSRIRKI